MNKRCNYPCRSGVRYRFQGPQNELLSIVFFLLFSQGFKLKMDDMGNILIKRVSKSGVRVRNTTEESAVSNDILKLPGGLLETDKPFKVRVVKCEM